MWWRKRGGDGVTQEEDVSRAFKRQIRWERQDFTRKQRNDGLFVGRFLGVIAGFMLAFWAMTEGLVTTRFNPEPSALVNPDHPGCHVWATAGRRLLHEPSRFAFYNGGDLTTDTGVNTDAEQASLARSTFDTCWTNYGDRPSPTPPIWGDKAKIEFACPYREVEFTARFYIPWQNSSLRISSMSDIVTPGTVADHGEGEMILEVDFQSNRYRRRFADGLWQLDEHGEDAYGLESGNVDFVCLDMFALPQWEEDAESGIPTYGCALGIDLKTDKLDSWWGVVPSEKKGLTAIDASGHRVVRRYGSCSRRVLRG